MSDAPQSSYCYPGTRVLINKLDLRDPVELASAERRFSAAALAQLEVRPIHGDFGLDHYMTIHRALMGGLYEWAGTPRTEDIQKRESVFGHHGHIGAYFNQVAEGLKADDYLRKAPDRDAFAQRAADYYAVINYAHPAREGNGRTTREYMRTLGMNAGFDVDWTNLDGNLLDAACRVAFPRNGQLGATSGLVHILREHTTNDLPRPDLRERYDALKASPEPEWRGTLGEAVLEAQRRAPGPIAFVSGSWQEQWRVRVQSPVDLSETAAKAAERWPATHSSRVYALGEDGAIRNTATGRDEYVAVRPGAAESYPAPLREAVDRHFGKGGPSTPAAPSRGPEMDGP